MSARPLSPELRAALAAHLGNAQSARADLVLQLGECITNVREHEHPKWEDLYCLNLVSYMGERMAPVLRRLVDAETTAERYRIAWGMARTRALSAGGAADRYAARARELQTAVQDMVGASLAVQMERNELRARVAELEQQATTRSEELRKAAAALRRGNTNWTDDTAAVVVDEVAEWLDRRADEAGKDTRKGESTRAASPWQRAVDGLNALVGAGIPVHIEPDGHIANPAGDEHIEWDRTAQRWRLVLDGEAERGAQPVTEWQLTTGNIAEVDEWLDEAGTFAKPYVESVAGRLTVVGIRVGLRPDHVVARFGDTLVRHADGTHTVRHAEGGDADA
ncbi:hypothetical protein AB0F64_37615 [Streptomyces sp. NPDC026294]|uniref:hypothetical protein n=1 Tax=Streptomyces sp. NPDC026294 TaxID=3155362 RepID=UPI0033CD2C59